MQDAKMQYFLCPVTLLWCGAVGGSHTAHATYAPVTPKLMMSHVPTSENQELRYLAFLQA